MTDPGAQPDPYRAHHGQHPAAGHGHPYDHHPAGHQQTRDELNELKQPFRKFAPADMLWCVLNADAPIARHNAGYGILTALLAELWLLRGIGMDDQGGLHANGYLPTPDPQKGPTVLEILHLRIWNEPGKPIEHWLTLLHDRAEDLVLRRLVEQEITTSYLRERWLRRPETLFRHTNPNEVRWQEYHLVNVALSARTPTIQEAVVLRVLHAIGVSEHILRDLGGASRNFGRSRIDACHHLLPAPLQVMIGGCNATVALSILTR